MEVANGNDNEKVAKKAADMEGAAAGAGGLAGCHSPVLVSGLRQRDFFAGQGVLPPVREGGTKWKNVNIPVTVVPGW